jgi:GTP-binding protein
MTEAPENEHEHDDASLERGRWLFAQEAVFISGAADYDGVPETRIPEIAFVGRSNVGKSSLINTLTGRKTLARTSNTPGRTQQINFFQILEALMLADLPGYGYAKASKTDIARWTTMIFDYLRGRAPLRRVCLLIDARHGLKDSDIRRHEGSRQRRSVLSDRAHQVRQGQSRRDGSPDGLTQRHRFAKHVAAHPVIVQTSSVKGHGVEFLRAELAMIADIR